jgi:hypothetical protein
MGDTKVNLLLNNDFRDSAFLIQPENADISPRTTFEFRVVFRPTQEERFYGKSIDAYISYKSMRNFRLSNEETFTPPWNLAAYIAG